MCHVLLDLVHDLHSLIRTPCFKVIALLLRGIIAAHDHHPEALGVPSADLGSDHIAEADRPGLAAGGCFARITGHDMHVIIFEREDPVVGCCERHGLFAEHMVSAVISA